MLLSVLQTTTSAIQGRRRVATLVVHFFSDTRQPIVTPPIKTRHVRIQSRSNHPRPRTPCCHVAVRFQHNDGAAAQEAQTTQKRPSTLTPDEQDGLERALKCAAERYERAMENGDESVQREVLLEVRDAYQDLQYWDDALQVEALWLDRYGGSTVDRAASLHRQGKLHMRLQESAKANRLYREALELYQREYGEAGICPEIGRVLISLAAVQYHRGHLMESLDLLKSAETNFSDLPEMIVCLQHQGLVHRSMEKFEGALESYQRAFQMMDLMHKESDWFSSPPELFYQRQGLRLDIADMLSANDRVQEALELYQDILEEDKEFVRRRHDPTPKVALEGVLMHNIGKLRAQLGEHEAAVDDLTRAIELKASLLGDTDPEMAKTWNALGAVHAVLGNQSQALDCFKQSLLICRMHYEESDAQVMLALRNIAVLKGHKLPKWGTEDKGQQS